MMQPRMKAIAVLTTGCLVLALCSAFPGGQKKVKKTVKVTAPAYASVEKIIKTNCAGCHQGERAAHHLDLTSYAATIKGDKEGKVIVPGDPAKSRFATVLHGKPKLMPPGHALPAADIAKLEAWIKGGAKK